MLRKLKAVLLLIVGLVTLPIWLPVGIVMKTSQYLCNRGQDVVNTTAKTYGMLMSFLSFCWAIMMAGRNKVIESLKKLTATKPVVETDPSNAAALQAAVAADEAAAAQA